MRVLTLLLSCALGWPCILQATETIVYPRPESATDRRSTYAIELLALALSKAGGDYRLEPSPLVMLQSRALMQIEVGSPLVSIAWTMSSRQREAHLLPIRIPLDKGLLGWRLLLVPQARRDLFHRVRGVADMQAFRAGQGHDWPDTRVLRASGLRVVESSDYELLFFMLHTGQIDYFPRSLAEVWDELNAHAALKLVIADGIALHYTAPMYYFVSKHNTRLADVVQRGLERAIADGSFDKLFQQHYGDVIRRAGLAQRRVLELPNPDLPAGVPVARPALWVHLPPHD